MSYQKSWKSVGVLLAALLLFTASYAQFDLGGSGDVDEKLVEMSATFSHTSAKSGNSYTGAVIYDISHGWHINSDNPTQDFLIPAEIQFEEVDGLKIHSVKYPPAETIDMMNLPMSVFEGIAIVTFSIDIETGPSVPSISLPVKATYQACNDKECRAPQTIDLIIDIPIGEHGDLTDPAIFGAMKNNEVQTENDESGTSDDSEIERLISEYGFWGYVMALGLAFVTGLVLSFSPCTYPMIPITVSIFGGQERSVGKGFVMSLFYVGSMAVIYGIMGLIVSMVGGVFGAWLASPAVVIGIAIVFVIFSLSMFGLYELQVPAALRNKIGTTQTGSGIGGAILLGVIAALVVSPCVGPFVAGILLYIATAGSPIFGFLTLFVFAIGLGTLYIIIGTFSSAINSLPRAGMWMETVKKFFGFVLLLMALYFLRTIISSNLIAFFTGMLLLGLAVFGGGLDRLNSESKAFDRIKKFIGILAFIGAIYLLGGLLLANGFILKPISAMLPVSSNSTVEKESLVDWETDLMSGLARAKAEGKPVIIDTWATWCINCKILEKETFGNSEVAAAMSRFVPLKIQLETSGSAESKQFMELFGIRQYSLPTVLLLNSNGDVEKILQGVVKPDEMLTELARIK